MLAVEVAVAIEVEEFLLVVATAGRVAISAVAVEVVALLVGIPVELAVSSLNGFKAKEQP